MKIELLVGLILLFILGIFLNPTHVFMPESMNMVLIVGFIVSFFAFIGLVWQERPKDEREESHMWRSGRLSYFVGATILVIGIVFQAFKHQIDPWLLYAFLAMVLVKVIVRLLQKYRS